MEHRVVFFLSILYVVVHAEPPPCVAPDTLGLNTVVSSKTELTVAVSITAAQCRQSCLSRPSCAAWKFVTPKNLCTINNDGTYDTTSGTVVTTTEVNVTSGFVNCPVRTFTLLAENRVASSGCVSVGSISKATLDECKIACSRTVQCNTINFAEDTCSLQNCASGRKTVTSANSPGCNSSCVLSVYGTGMDWIEPPQQMNLVVVATNSVPSVLTCISSSEDVVATESGIVSGSQSATWGQSVVCPASVTCTLNLATVKSGDHVWCVAVSADSASEFGSIATFDWGANQSEDLAADVDNGWILLCGFLVFFMQPGFAMLEVGCVQVKNVSSIIFKNAGGLMVSALAFWFTGWAFSFGGDSLREDRNEFIGSHQFLLFSSGDFPDNTFAVWLFQWVFCAAATTIVSGPLAERVKSHGYLLYCIFMAGFIYPVVVHWLWSAAGFLSPFANPDTFRRLGKNGSLDFAGSGGVHLCGGTCSLVGAFILGPRTGRFGLPGETKEEAEAREIKFAPHNKVLVALGTFLLWFGWFGFNCGSTLKLSSHVAFVAAKVAVTTTLSAVSAGLSALILVAGMSSVLSVDAMLNGLLTGLVAITSGCSLVEPYAAIIIGLIAGPLYVLCSSLVPKMGVDDPIGGVGVHMAGGLWGLIAPGLFCTKDNLLRSYALDTGKYGLFYGGGGEQLGVQIVSGICIIAWSAVTSAIVFGILKATGHLRANVDEELYGLDHHEHGSVAYSSTHIVNSVVTDMWSHPNFERKLNEQVEKTAVVTELRRASESPTGSPTLNPVPAVFTRDTTSAQPQSIPPTHLSVPAYQSSYQTPTPQHQDPTPQYRTEFAPTPQYRPDLVPLNPYNPASVQAHSTPANSRAESYEMTPPPLQLTAAPSYASPKQCFYDDIPSPPQYTNPMNNMP